MKKSDHQKKEEYYLFLKKVLKPILPRFLNYEFEEAPELSETYLVLCNHVTFFDPFLCAFSFKKHMYFLIGEHVLRLGLISKIINKILKPVSKKKGKNQVSFVRELIDHLREGHNCCLFPEGNLTFNGESISVEDSIGKFLKIAKVTLVTFKFEGGYFTMPRWSTTKRIGRFFGHVVSVYTSEVLKEKSAAEIAQIINTDLYENAYERQKITPSKYKGKKLAEGLEVALYMCPNCHGIQTLVTKNDRIVCRECGIKGIYTEYGTIEGDFLYSNILEWDKFQKKELENRTEEFLKERNNSQPIVMDSDLVLRKISSDHKKKVIDKGDLAIYIDRIEVGKSSFNFTSLADMAVCLRHGLLFSEIHGDYYEAESKKFGSARKYIVIFNYIRSKTEEK